MPLFAAGDAERIEEVYAALRASVETFGGATPFAAYVEQPIPKVSMRLRRADDGKGTRQLAPIDYLGYIASDLNARAVFLAGLCGAWGFRPPELRRRITPEERANILAGAVTDKVKRQLEREQGLPAGTLG